jgi:hypothetical protein
MTFDPDRFWAALGAVPGAALYGLYHLAILLREGRKVTLTDIRDLLLNIACAVLCGVLLAYMLAKPVAALIPWVTLRDPVTIGFVLGAFGWELLPLVFAKFKGRAAKELNRIDGGDQ